MKKTIVKEQDIIVSKWAGGESRQYYIYPPESSYASRNFMFRISMATSYSDEEAKYSNLENFTRYLIMLEGKAHVFHKNHNDVILNPYENIDVFDGGWDSSASGKVVDFNLMTSKNTIASMSVMDKSDVIKINNESKNKNWLLFFCGYGSASFELPLGERIIISKNELIVFEDIENLEIRVKFKDSKLIKMLVSSVEFYKHCGSETYMG